MKRTIILGTAIWMATAAIQAQTGATAENARAYKAFEHVDMAVNMGSTGIGVDFATPLNEFFRLRAGLEYMPQFEQAMHFGIEGVREDNGSWITTNFDNIAAKLESFTGYRADDQVDMLGKPTFYNFKLLVDVFPFENKHWYFTAGFYLGNARVAKAVNATEDAPSLVAVGIYNNMYNKVEAGDPIYGDVYLSPDIENQILNMGRLGVHVGEYSSDITDNEGNIIHAKGSPYLMEPDANGMVRCEIKVNRVKPYMGFGYQGRLSEKSDKWNIGFDCGALFWGGTPRVYTHDGTDIANDVENIKGKVGRYVDVVQAFKVYPVANLRISYRLF